MPDREKEPVASETTELSDFVEITRVSGEKEKVTREQLRWLKRIERGSGEVQWGTREEIRSLNRKRREEKTYKKHQRKRLVLTMVGSVLLFAGIVLSKEGLDRVKQEATGPDLAMVVHEKPSELGSDNQPEVNSNGSADGAGRTSTSASPSSSGPTTTRVDPPQQSSLSQEQSTQPLVLPALDVKPPRIELTSAPSGTIAHKDARFQFHATNEEAMFAFFLEGSEETYSEYVDTNAKTYTDLPDGSYTFYLKARDRVGNVVREPLNQSFTIDTTPPTAHISEGPNGIAADRNVIFRFEANETAQFSSQLEGYDTQFTPYDSTAIRTFYDLPDGTYTLRVRARDALGNTQTQATEQQFMVDTQTPNARIVQAPESIISQRAVRFEFDANKEADFSFYLVGEQPDFGPFAGKRTAQYSNLKDGEYTFMVKARDVAGNEDPAPAVHTFRVDTQAPTIMITRGPRGPIPYDNVTFFYQASEPAVFSYFLEGYEMEFSEFTSEPSRTYHNLPDGTYTFHIRAKDSAGNLTQQEANQRFAIRTTDELYQQDFEDPKLKLVVRDEDEHNGKVAWGYTSQRLHEGKYSLWCAATGNTSRQYAKNMNSWFEIPVDLSYYAQGNLTFWYYLDTTQDVTDQFMLSVRDSGAEREKPFAVFWKPLLELNQQPKWTKQVISLDAHAGKAIVLRFYFISDDKFEDEGVYIDSIKITGKY